MAGKISLANQKKYKANLKAAKKSLEKRISEFKNEDPFADPNHTINNAAVDTDVRGQIGHQTIEAEIEALTKRLKLVRLALDRLTKNSYGVCESCGKTIQVQRLNIVPEARYCISCENRLVA